MKIKHILTLGIIAMSIISCSKKLQDADYHVIPLPKEITESIEGKPFTLSSTVQITYPKDQAELLKEANFLSEYIDDILGYSLKVKATDKFKNKAINLKINSSDFDHNDAYQIIVKKNNINIIGSKASSVFYGIQTLRKSLPIGKKEQKVNMPAAVINDYPRFDYRGIMLDVSRHMFPLDSIKEFIEAIALHNINKFHLHITDDQGWRMEIKKYPKLTEIGAWRSGTKIGKTEEYDTIRYGGFYTQEELRDLVQYAADRHITIIPEIDLPGHQLAALSAYPELGCTGGPYEVWGHWGVSEDVICAGNEKSMQFLEDVLLEVMDVFPSKYIHIGGDECPRIKWKQCPKCQAKIKELGLKDDNKHKAEDYLESYVVKRMEQFVEDHGRHIIGWDEILDGELAPNATVMSWRSSEGGKQAALQHHKVIMSPRTHLYFDYYQTDNTDNEPIGIGGYNPVIKVYSFEPVPEGLTEEESKYILGPQANLWTEYISDISTAFYRSLPRMDALSEVQWCLPEQKNYNDFIARTFKMVDLYDLYHWNYAKHIFDINVKMVPNIEEKCIDVNMSKFGEGNILYTLDGSDPLTNGIKYVNPLKINKNCKLRAIVARKKNTGREYYTTFDFSKSSMKPITLKNEPDKKYYFDGPNTLIDGLSGGMNYKTGRWLGFFGENIDAIIDLQEKQEINSVSFNCNINKNDWIYNAKNVKVLVSDNDSNFNEIYSQDFPILSFGDKDCIYPVKVTFEPIKTRYVEVIIEPFMLPERHSGYGYPAWLFVDEIRIN